MIRKSKIERSFLEELKEIRLAEEKILKNATKTSGGGRIRKELEKKVPETLMGTLQKAFFKGFELIFEKGDVVIDKTFDKDAIAEEFSIRDKDLDLSKSRTEVKKVGKNASLSKNISTVVTTVEGMGLGALGIGLPDIVIFVTMLLRGVYESALMYGFEYDSYQEKMFILKMMEASMQTGDEFRKLNGELDDFIEAGINTLYEDYDQMYELEAEKEIARDKAISKQIEKTANAFATEMLVTKFIQGMPVVGVLGGATNPMYYQKVINYVQLKYKKRYLMKKI